MKKGYKLKLSDFERHGGIERLEQDGYNREDIHRAMYKETDGASQRFREDLMSKLYEREGRYGK